MKKTLALLVLLAVIAIAIFASPAMAQLPQNEFILVGNGISITYDYDTRTWITYEYVYSNGTFPIGGVMGNFTIPSTRFMIFIPLIYISTNLFQNDYVVIPYLTLNFYGNGEHKYSIVLFHHSYKSPSPLPDRSYCWQEDDGLYRFSQLLVDIRRPPASTYDNIYRTYDFISKCIPYANSSYSYVITNFNVVIYSDTGDINIHFDINNTRYVIKTNQPIAMTNVDTVEIKYFTSYVVVHGELTGMFSDNVIITQYPPSIPIPASTPSTTIIAPEPTTPTTTATPQKDTSWLLIGLGIAVMLILLLSLRKPEKFKEQSS